MKIEINFKKLLQNKRNIYASVIIIILSIFILTVFYIYFFTPRPQQIAVLNINSPDSVITINDTIVPPVLYEKMPVFDTLETSERKRIFLNIMMPTILIAQEIIKHHREEIIKLKNKQGESAEEDSLLLRMMKNFKAKDIDDLILRMHNHPVSLILAQSAIESGWGTSRFCREANNIFGVWSFSKKENRIAAGKNRGAKTIYLKKYESLLGSVMDYMYTLGGSSAFDNFRKVRIKSGNSFRLIWFLTNYSEKRMGYVVTLRNTMEHNDLTQYDKYQLVKIKAKDQA